MRDNKASLCSDLILVSARGVREIANLERIDPNGCELTMQEALPVGQKVSLQCLECPQGKKACTECRFNGRVQSRETDPLLGNSMRIDFLGRNWSAKEWQPRHLTNLKTNLTD